MGGYHYVTGSPALPTKNWSRGIMDDPFHLWARASAGDEWDCLSEGMHDSPAACGARRGGAYVKPIAQEFNSLREWARDSQTCTDCVVYLRRRHGLPSDWPDVSVRRLGGGD